MFRALLCPSSGAHDYSADYHMGRPGGNQHYSRELVMMGIAVPEICWAYHKYNKKISSI